MEWSDLKIFLAIARAGTLGGAARQLGQTQPTMGRRLRALEASLGQVLFQRTVDGFVLTEEGNAVLSHAERMEQEALAVERQLAGSQVQLEGLLRISSSDWFGTYMLAPVLAEFGRLHPKVCVELLTDSRLYSLPRREADLVFRIRPFDEPEVISRRLLHMPYAAYIADGIDIDVSGDGEGIRLITMDTGFADMPDAVWLARKFPKASIGLRSNSREVQAELCRRGAGLAVLPTYLGERVPGITMVTLGEAPPSRETYLGYHKDMRRLPRLRALLDIIIPQLAG